MKKGETLCVPSMGTSNAPKHLKKLTHKDKDIDLAKLPTNTKADFKGMIDKNEEIEMSMAKQKLDKNKDEQLVQKCLNELLKLKIDKTQKAAKPKSVQIEKLKSAMKKENNKNLEENNEIYDKFYGLDYEQQMLDEEVNQQFVQFCQSLIYLWHIKRQQSVKQFGQEWLIE